MDIPSNDRGFALGDGLFETVLAVDGRLVGLAAHLDRLAFGCVSLGLPTPDRAQAEQLMGQALAEAGLATGRAAVRLTLTAGSGGRGLDRPAEVVPRMLATAAPSPRPQTPARLATTSVRRNERSPTSRLKTLAYLDNVLARREAQAAGADEALMLNTAGAVASAAAANLFWIVGDRLFTPALSCGVLAGTQRARVIAAAGEIGVEVVETGAPLAALAVAQGVFLTNALVGVRAVSAIDGRTLPASPLTARLAAAVEAQ